MAEKLISNLNRSAILVRKLWLPIILALLVLPTFYTAPHIILKSESPDGELDFPENVDSKSEGLILIVLDGVGEDYLLSDSYMPRLDALRDEAAILNVRTGPLTLSATCISEMMTGVPNSPIDGLRNFDLSHPGGEDPWLSASSDERYDVGMVGSYVMGNIYREFEGIDFVNTFKGHSDYYEGDNETLDIASKWIDESNYNVIAAHFSGPDKVGHSWGIVSDEYKQKLLHLDNQVVDLIQKVPQNWSIIVTADHGMTEIGSHGSSEEDTRNVAALIFGPDILPETQSDANQRDISALVPLLLELSFPVQLHGRIPLDILNHADSDKEIIEKWNWEAAYLRQSFINSENGLDSSELSQDEIDWNLISVEGEFTRDSDVIISLITWTAIVIISFIALRIDFSIVKENWKFFGVFFTTLALFLLSQASLEYSAMIHRSIGGLCAVWLVSWSLGRKNKSDSVISKNVFADFCDKLVSNHWLWIFFTCILFTVLYSSSKGVVQTISQVVVSVLLLYSVLYSVRASFGPSSNNSSNYPTYIPWLLAMLAFTFGSIRLWFALIPLLFVTLGWLVEYFIERKPVIEKLPLISMLMLTAYGVFCVHRRIVGEHYVLEAVKMGWPSDWQNILISAGLLISAAFISTTAINDKLDRKKSLYLSIWLIFGLFVSYLSSSYLDRLVLLLIASGYIVSIYLRLKNEKSDMLIQLLLPSLSMQILLTWGSWSAFVTLIILSCSGKMWRIFSKSFSHNPSIEKLQPLLAMAAYPWVIWILWWTLLGQVNGLQTCFEGICPHPRELDPGSVIVRGGYVGFRENPNVLWMVLMISSPIIIASAIMIHQIGQQDLDLEPYAISQALIILGCMSVISLSPQYPRLMFSLIWNIFFAMLQLIVVTLVISFNKFFDSNDSTQQITEASIENV